MNIARDLNKAQAEAVYHYKGPLLVLAGPGSGKTRVITYRAAYLIREHQISPESILAVTFTNKAAQEMLNRLHSDALLGETVGMEVWIHTFHAACVRILRQYGERIGLNPRFAVIDENDQEILLSGFIRESKIPEDCLWLVRDFISDAKIRLENPSEVNESERLKRFNERANEDNLVIDIQDVSSIVRIYQEYLKSHDALDFDDIVSTTVRLLAACNDVKYELQKRFQFVMVDEYQDINMSQYELIRHISNPERNIMVVADDDQSIYSWRGSDPGFIDKFKEQYNPRIVQLVDHFRSTRKLLRASQSLIEKNTRIKKGSLITDNDSGDIIYHYSLNDADEETKFMLWLIRRLIRERHYSPGQIAIFYRTHKLADRLEQYLVEHKIPVRRIRRESLFNAHIRSMIGYLRFLCWDLEPDLEKMINFPDTIMDELTKSQLEMLAKNKKLIDLLRNIDSYEEAGPLTKNRIRGFIELVDTVASSRTDEPISKIMKGLVETLESARSPYHTDDLSAIQNPDSLGNLWLAVNAIYGAIQSGNPIYVLASYGIDNYSAAEIIVYVLQNYLNVTASCYFLPSDMQENASIINSLNSDPSDNDPLYIITGSVDNIPDSIIERAIVIGDSPTISVRRTKQDNVLFSSPSTKSCVSALLAGEGGVVSTTALKLCQRLMSLYESGNTDGLVVYDLETISNNVRTAEIIEIGARKIGTKRKKDDDVIYHQLVKPKNFIPKSSTDIHGIKNEDVNDKPGIQQVLSKFIDFIGDSILVGHNIVEFDNKVISRFMATYMNTELSNRCYDTFIVAKKLFPFENYKLDALADKFGISYNDLRLHRSLGDIALTEQVFRRLRREELIRTEKKSLKELLPLVAIGILEKNAAMEKENIAFYNAALRYIRYRKYDFSDEEEEVIELQPILHLDAAEEEEAIRFLDRMRQEDPPITKDDEEWNAAVSRLQNIVLDFEHNAYDRSLSSFLNYAALLTGTDEFENEDKITMMTVHSAKGMEFPVVIMMGMEQGNFPIISRDQTEAELEEERRLCYVGMTRAKTHLYLTSVKYRISDREATPSQFIWEIQPDLIKTVYSDQISKNLNKAKGMVHN